MFSMSLLLLLVAPEQSPASPSATGGKMVCKSVKVTGSRLDTNRVCATAREWRLAEEEAQKSVRDRQMSSKLFGGSEDPTAIRSSIPQ